MKKANHYFCSLEINAIVTSMFYIFSTSKLLKIPLFFFLLFACNYSFAQLKTNLELEGKMNLLLTKSKAGNLTKENTAELKNIGLQFEQIASEFNDRQHDYQYALLYTNKAIQVFQALNSSLDEANNESYKGYLLGRSKDFILAKHSIDTSIFTFTALQKPGKIATTKYHLSRVYEFQEKNDSALYYANVSANYFKNNNDTIQLLNANNQLINIYTKTKKYKEADIIVKQNDLFISNAAMPYQQVIDHCFVSAALYKKWKKNTLAKQYRKAFDTKIADLKNESITTKSSFETP